MTSQTLRQDFRPYEVKESNLTIEQIFNNINQKIFSQYCQANSSTKLETVADYRSLLTRLLDLNISSVPFSEVDFSEAPPSNQVQCLIRHDLDIDVVSALSMAKIERDLGIRSSWYILHTAPYYGTFGRDGVFYRNESMRHVYRAIQDMGHEIALHTDGLHVYQNQRRNGAQAIETEIAWLREAGIDVRGTTAHNSWGIYGAENFALFDGKPLRGGTKAGECPNYVEHNGVRTPLQVLSEKELGLSYEANEVFWQRHTPVRYAAIRSKDSWRWSDKQSRANTQPSGALDGFQSSRSILDNLQHVNSGEWLVLVIHPIYYGHRHASYAPPCSTI